MSINNLRGQDNNKKTNSIIANELFESFCERPENKHKSKDILISEFIKKHNLNTSNGLIEQF